MPRLVALLLLVAACRTESGPQSIARIRALAGTQTVAWAGITVYGHTADGELLAEDQTDAAGIATLGVAYDSFVTLQFPDNERTLIITTPAPPEGSTLEVYGPTAPISPLVVGTVHIDAPLLPGATSYEIDIGCVTVTRTQFPESLDVTACSTNFDRELDVVIRAFHDSGTTRVFDGYAAQHVPLVDGIGNFAASGWKTTGPTLPLTVGVANPEINYTFYVDGNTYAGPPVVANQAFYYDELDIESASMRARIGATPAAQTYEVRGPIPTPFDVQPERFLPPIELSTTRAGDAFAWNPAPVTADRVVLRVIAKTVTWEAILPADATTIALPISIPDDGTTTLSYFRSSALDPLEVYSTTIVAPADATQIATTEISGLL